MGSSQGHGLAGRPAVTSPDVADPLPRRVARARKVLEPLAALVPELAGEGERLADLMLALRDRGGTRAAASGLNADGAPLELRWTAAPDGHRIQLVADPAIDRTGASERYAAAVRALQGVRRLRADASLEPLFGSLLEHLGPTAERPLARFGLGVLWVAAGIDQPGCGAYVDVSVNDAGQAWDAVEAWLREALPDTSEARRVAACLREHAVPASAGVEGVSGRQARCTLTLRLRWPVGPRHPALPLLAGGTLLDVLATLTSARPVHLAGVLLHIGFDTVTGAVLDTTIDLCGHCLGYARHLWPEVVARTAAAAGVPCPPTGHLLAEVADLALVGIGCDRSGTPRLDVRTKGRV